MVSIQTKTRIGADGRLDVQLPAEYREQNVSVTVIVEPANADVNDHENTDNKNSWPATFFEQTAGAWQGEPLARGEQGSYESRDLLK